MPKSSFAHVTDWVFDLDNTLYSPDAGLFVQVEHKMTAYVVRELGLPETTASALRHEYWRTYGTTLAGLMREHGVAPGPYLAEVHDIDYSILPQNPALGAAITALPGRKIVFTNGPRSHAEKACAASGLHGCFEKIYGIEDAGFVPKPNAGAFAQVFRLDGLAPHAAAMFEDDALNLRVPHQLGMRTVLVGPGELADHVHHRTDDLAGFLTQLV